MAAEVAVDHAGLAPWTEVGARVLHRRSRRFNHGGFVGGHLAGEVKRDTPPAMIDAQSQINRDNDGGHREWKGWDANMQALIREAEPPRRSTLRRMSGD
jgi:hypothetical protein